MKIGFIVSTLIAGVVFLSVLQLNNLVFTQTGSSTLKNQLQVRSGALMEVLASDLNKIGFNVSGNGILVANATKISFTTDLMNDGVIRTITWEVKPDNEDKKKATRLEMYRTVDNHEVIYSVDILQFTFDYFDNDRNKTSNIHEIRHIGVNMFSETTVIIDGKSQKNILQRTFSPVNLSQRVAEAQ